MIRPRIETFWIQKNGNTKGEYEDAWWIPRSTQLGERIARCAVADGATDAVFSRLWARILTRSFGKGQFAPDPPDSVTISWTRCSNLWKRAVRGRKLPWYAEEKARSGAYAALVGLELVVGEGGDGGSWNALACGDSCLFQVRDSELINAFPLTRSDEFTNSPILLCSLGPRDDDATHVRFTSGGWITGDRFYLMTDALANWFVANWEAGGRPWGALFDIGESPFSEWLNALRASRQIKNDDCTLISITVEDV